MQEYIIKEISNTNIEQELTKIGFDSSYTHRAKDKFIYKNFKIYDLTPAQANILKQIALSVGADCGTHREVITGKAEKSDCILGGSISQLEKISQKLSHQPFGLKFLGEKILNCICDTPHQTKIIGILNITTNSFSDGGEFYDFKASVKHLTQLIKDGADIIDIGAESTKPYSSPVSPDKQLEKLLPVLNYIKENNIEIPISIDTRSSVVAEECIKAGAVIINDVSGFDYDTNMANIVSKHGVRVIIQHSKGEPENMQNNPVYDSLIDEIYLSLNNKINYAISNDIKKENIIVDPGIGFGKTKEDNFEIINRWKEFKTLGCPVLIGLSRKSLLSIPNAANEEKDLYTLALNSNLIQEGIDYIRVHNVKIHKTFQNIIL